MKTLFNSRAPTCLCLNTLGAICLAAALVLTTGGCAQSGQRKPDKSPNVPVASEGGTLASDLQAMLDQARAYLAGGQPEQAIVALTVAQRDFPGSVQPVLMSGRIYEQLGQSDSARELYEAYILRGGTSVAVQSALGLLHLRSGRTEIARSLLQSVAAHDRSTVRWQAAMADDEAHALAAAYNGLGVIADRDEEFELAGEYYLRALQIEKSPESYTNLGYSRFLDGNYGGAEWAYDQALLLIPDYRPAILNMALLSSTLGQYHRARELLRSINADPRLYAAIGLELPANNGGEKPLATDLLAVSSAPSIAPISQPATQSASPPEQSRPKMAGSGAGVVFARLLRIRDTNSLDGEVIGWLKTGTELTVVDESGEWLYVEYTAGSTDTKLRGWVASRFVRRPQA